MERGDNLLLKATIALIGTISLLIVFAAIVTIFLLPVLENFGNSHPVLSRIIAIIFIIVASLVWGMYSIANNENLLETRFERLHKEVKEIKENLNINPH